MRDQTRDRLDPGDVGIGLRLAHMAQLAHARPEENLIVPWLEVHSENFLCDGGPRLAMLHAIAARYPISCHGVGLSLGSAEGLDRDHLARLRRLHASVKPILVSEHLSWSVTGGEFLNDLLPLPYTPATLEIVSRNIDHAQQILGRRILVENPSAYLTFPLTTMTETEFLGALVQRTACGLLVDVNNIYVTAVNTTRDADAAFKFARTYLDATDAGAVGEIHLAGHSIVGEGEARVLIDTHSTEVCGDVWRLYRHAIARLGPRPTLIEWDLDVPALPVLLAEAARARTILTASLPGGRYVT